MRILLTRFVVLMILSAIPLIVACDDNGGGDGGGGGGGNVEIDADDIGGTVSSNPPEAGVWVIAETEEVLTNQGQPATFRKIVVTDDNGQFVIPDLPPATYNVWVRGYGLVDSEPVQASPGEIIDIQVQPASSPQEAAQVYPANYWYALMDLPPDAQFGEGSGWNVADRGELTNRLKLGCELCHQVGTAATRLPNGEAFDFGWKKSGTMNGTANGIGRENMVAMFGDWGERIAAGEVPPEQPPRPQGIERNVVITYYEWGDLFAYAHDEIATDKRNPFLYPYGKVYGVDIGNDRLLITDPVTNESSWLDVPTRGGYDEAWGFATLGQPAEDGTSAYLGAYHNPANPHNPMMDDEGKVWMTTQIRAEGDDDTPDFCFDMYVEEEGEVIDGGHRQLGYYDTVTEEFVLIDTCYGTHHLQFDGDGNLWSSGDSNYFGVLYPDLLDTNNCGVESCPSEQQAQELWRMVVDSDGDGEADTPISGFNYGIIPNLVDGTIWSANPGYPGQIRRFDPATEMFEVYEPPAPGHGPRGIDADTEGNIWTCLGGSSHVARFDRTQCAQTWGLGDQCPEGWTLWEIPGPNFQGTNIKSDFHYYIWVDQFDVLGLGANTVVCNGTGSDSIIAFNPETEQFTRFVSPYPLGFFQRGLDGRIDDPNAGWKGRGWWIDYGIDPVLHVEDQTTYIMQVQLRNSPLDH